MVAALRMKNVFYIHPDGIILNSSFYILHFIKNFSASIAALQPEPAATTA